MFKRHFPALAFHDDPARVSKLTHSSTVLGHATQIVACRMAAFDVRHNVRGRQTVVSLADAGHWMWTTVVTTASLVMFFMIEVKNIFGSVECETRQSKKWVIELTLYIFFFWIALATNQV